MGMSVLGHFVPRHGSLRMPRREDGVDEKTGIRYEGEVLTGKVSVEEALRNAEIRARQGNASPEVFPAAGGESVPGPGEKDEWGCIAGRHSNNEPLRETVRAAMEKARGKR